MFRSGGSGVIVVLALAAFPPCALGQMPKDLVWTHAFDLSCRKFGEAQFSSDTQRFGVEAFTDKNHRIGLYVTQKGSLAIAPGFVDTGDEPKDAVQKSRKGPEWLTGLDLPARRAGEKMFNKQTKVHSLEVFRDPNSNNWLYITENGHLAVTSAAKAKKTAGSQSPKWLHSVDLSVRKGGERSWEGASKFGIEVYRDPNANNLLFVCETGQVAVLAETKDVKPGGKAPDWLHGLDLACRKPDEKSFSKSTRKFGIEAFHDSATGSILLICETGSIAVVPATASVNAPTPNVKEPVWTHGVNVKCRRHGEKDFTPNTQVFGAEVFRDDNLGILVSISETGTISALAKSR